MKKMTLATLIISNIIGSILILLFGYKSIKYFRIIEFKDLSYKEILSFHDERFTTWFLKKKNELSPNEFSEYIEKKRAERDFDIEENYRERREEEYYPKFIKGLKIAKTFGRTINYKNIEINGRNYKVHIVINAKGSDAVPYVLVYPEDFKDGTKMVVESLNSSGSDKNTTKIIEETARRNLEISPNSPKYIVHKINFITQLYSSKRILSYINQ